MRSSGIYDGVFWLAQEPEQRVAGRLDLSTSTPALTLFEPLIAPLETAEVRQPGGEDTRVTTWTPRSIGPDVEAFTILGEIYNPRRHVTLLESFTLAYDDEQRMQAGCALINGHVGDTLRLSAVSFRLPYLDEWANVAEVEGTVSDTYRTIRYGTPTPLRQDLPDPMACTLELSCDVTHPRISWRSARIDYTSRLSLQNLREVPMAAVWWALGAISDLFSLLVDVKARPTEVEVLDAGTERWLEVIDPRLADEPSESASHLRRILLPRAGVGLGIFARWIERYNELRPIPAILADSMRLGGDVLESKLFELASAAEGLHRRLIDTTRTDLFTRVEARAVRKAARQAAGENEHLDGEILRALNNLTEISYAERLDHLLQMATPALPGLADWNCLEWKSRITDARNGVAHRLPAFHNVPWENKWREETVLFYSARWLLTTLLLLEAGVEPSLLIARLGQHRRFRIFEEQAKHWLPVVFA
jgi:hypothetical protein